MQSEEINFLEFIKDSSHSDEKKIEIQEKVNKLNAGLDQREESDYHVEEEKIKEKIEIHEVYDKVSKNDEDVEERRSINEKELQNEEKAKIINSLILDGAEISEDKKSN